MLILIYVVFLKFLKDFPSQKFYGPHIYFERA